MAYEFKLTHRFARFTGETMFPPWAPFFSVLAAGGNTAARNKFRSATEILPD